MAAASDPKPEGPRAAGSFADPRSFWGLGTIGVIGFCHPTMELRCEDVCDAEFLASDFDLGAGNLLLEAPCERGRVRSFSCAEAAFQATMFWPLSDLFVDMSANSSLEKVARFSSHRDSTCGGFGNSWKAMEAVLRVKFAPTTAATTATATATTATTATATTEATTASCADLLLKTGDAFILECGDEPNTGRAGNFQRKDRQIDNWLGALLMLTRDRLSGRRAWSDYIESLIDVNLGEAKSSLFAEQWHRTVHRALISLEQVLKEAEYDG
eukprot:TRINITY_DN9817_c0_g1_i1.p1 TRINITY_DN9817_c0_g1~~TRINITY_DN9817_c0_g1_i1.p1  ORF type:complete len:270 (+),score=67.44 TRINITY_DN9817_c0_g1_i1:337-1146(+)